MRELSFRVIVFDHDVAALQVAGVERAVLAVVLEDRGVDFVPSARCGGFCPYELRCSFGISVAVAFRAVLRCDG